MAKKKFYVIWEGKETGIFETWNECKANIHGYPKAKYKSFKNKELAEKAYQESYYEYAGKDVNTIELTKEEIALYGDPILDSISVDAACSGNPGLLEYQGVFTETKETIFKQGPFEYSTVNMGEFLAIVHALAELKLRNDKRPIYSDSKVAMGWVKDGKCNTYLDQTDSNKKTFQLIARAEKWLAENSYENKILKWETKAWGEIPADFGRKRT